MHGDDFQVGYLDRRPLREFGELRVHDQHTRFAVTQHKEQGGHVEPGIERIEHGARHRHAKMRFDHGRNIRQQHGDRLPTRYARAFDRTREAAGSLVRLAPGPSNLAVDHGESIAIHLSRTRDEINGGQRDVVRLAALQTRLEHVFHRCLRCVCFIRNIASHGGSAPDPRHPDTRRSAETRPARSAYAARPVARCA